MTRPVRPTLARSAAAIAVAMALAALTHSVAPSPARAADETENRLQFHGYGEFHYNNPQTGTMDQSATSEADVHRFVLGWTYDFTSEIRLDAELDYEHAARELELEYAHLDYDLSPTLSLRMGSVLMPVGPLNEFHEPPLYYSVERPYVERYVIPTTWRDIGVGLVGTLPGGSGLGYRVYLLNGLVASGFSAEEGIREGRQEGHEASFANPSLTGRLEWVRPGLRIGGSFWYGGSAAQDPALGTGTFDNAVALLSADARYDVGPFMFRGVVANVSIADAEAINAAYGGQVGSRIAGGYVEGAYNVLSVLAPESTQRLNAFIRHERYNTQAGVPVGVVRDDTLARRITTLGLSYKPVYNVAFKGDYQLRRNRAGVGEDEQLSLGVGYEF